MTDRPTSLRSIDSVTAGRLPPVSSDADHPVLNPVFDVFRSRGLEPPVLYRTLANAPEMLSAWVGMAWPLRENAKVSRRLRELAIMRVGQLTRAEGEWIAHWSMAVEHGVTEAQLADMSSWRTSDAFSEEERAVLAFTDELTLDLEVSERSFAAMADHFEPGEIVEISLTVAFYSCAARILLGLGFRPVNPADGRLAHLRPAGG